MKMIYALPLAVVAAMVVSGCSKKSDNTMPAASVPAMQSAPSSAMSSHQDAMPAQQGAAMPAPASSSHGAMSSAPSAASTAQ